MKKTLFMGIAIFLGASVSQAIGVVVVRKVDGNFRTMTHHQAMSACPAGTHLPTLREVYKETELEGAKGILELGDVNPNLVPRGFSKSTVANNVESSIGNSATKDEFYYSFEGLNSSQQFPSYIHFWTSSSVDNGPSDGDVYYELSDAHRVWVYSMPDRTYSAGIGVRCFPNL